MTTATPAVMPRKISSEGPAIIGGLLPGDAARKRDRNTRRHSTLLSGLRSAADLDRLEFPPLVEHVPHLITEGFGILAGPPKAGKSWLTGGIALGCAYGGTVLDKIHVDPRHVLLLALEDGPRRLQSRMRHLTEGAALPKRLDILTEIAPGTVIATISEWLELHVDDENRPLVILDTLGKARPQRRAGDDPYIADYQLGSRIKATVDALPGAALLAVHHTRKMASEDWLDSVSGTQGIAGSADYILLLRRKRKSDDGTLAVTGRDIAENEYAVTTDNGRWSLDGMDILDAAATVTTRAEQQQNRLGDRSLDAVTFVNSRATTTPKDLAQHLGIDNRIAGNLLAKLRDGGYIEQPARGVYTAPLGGETGESGENAGQPQDPLPAISPVSPLSPLDGEAEEHAP
ncbi:MAG: hypothetical protein QG597_2934 [Actinomycetota bacterium]|nr:hypothetical protein [Actinomycetota bacterium]